MAFTHGDQGAWGQGNNTKSVHDFYTDSVVSTSPTAMAGMGDNDPAIQDYLKNVGGAVVMGGTQSAPLNQEEVVRVSDYVSEEYHRGNIVLGNDMLQNIGVKLYKINEESLVRRPIIYRIKQKKLVVTSPGFTLERFKKTLKLEMSDVPFNAGGWLDRYIVDEFNKNMNTPYVASLESFVGDYVPFKRILTSPGTANISTETKDKIKAWLENLTQLFIVENDEVYTNEEIIFIMNSDQGLYTELNNVPISKLLVTPNSFLYQLLVALGINDGTVVIYSNTEEKSWPIFL